MPRATSSASPTCHLVAVIQAHGMVAVWYHDANKVRNHDGIASVDCSHAFASHTESAPSCLMRSCMPQAREGCAPAEMYDHSQLVCTCNMSTGIYAASNPIEVSASHPTPVPQLHPEAAMLMYSFPAPQVADCAQSNDVVHALVPTYATVDSTPSASVNVTVRGWEFDWDTKDQIR